MTRTRFAMLVSIAAAGPLIALAPRPAVTSAQPEDEAKAIDPVAADAQKATRVMELLATLEGEWRLLQEDGTLGEDVSVFKKSSGGSVVREIMLVGEPHEMTNLYHMDGDTVVCTHYCAVGNQPRMIASDVVVTADGPSLDFRVDSVSNFTEGQDHYMGGLRLTLIDPDTVHQDWTTFNAEGEVDHAMTFKLRRVKATD